MLQLSSTLESTLFTVYSLYLVLFSPKYINSSAGPFSMRGKAIERTMAELHMSSPYPWRSLNIDQRVFPSALISLFWKGNIRGDWASTLQETSEVSTRQEEGLMKWQCSHVETMRLLKLNDFRIWEGQLKLICVISKDSKSIRAYHDVMSNVGIQYLMGWAKYLWRW